MAKAPYRDPRGHSLRIYSDLYDSPAFSSLSPHDVLAYLALLRDLKQYNNGDLSLPLSKAKKHGVKHHVTLARSLRALCAVGLIAVTRKGGATRDGQRLPNLYRVTDRDCYDIPAKHISAKPATNEWKTVTSVAQGKRLIADAETKAAEEATAKSEAIKEGLARSEKLISPGHRATGTTSPRDAKPALTRTRRDSRVGEPCHDMSLAHEAANQAFTRHSGRFLGDEDFASHKTRGVPPLQGCQSKEDSIHVTGCDELEESAERRVAKEVPVETITALWQAVGRRAASVQFAQFAVPIAA